MFLEVGPGYTIAVSRKPSISGYPGWSQTVVISWQKHSIFGNRGSLVLLIDPSETFDALTKNSTFGNGSFAGSEYPHECAGEPDLILGGFTRIAARIYPERGGAFFDDPRCRNEERDPDKSSSVSSSKDSNGSVFEVNRQSAGNFCARSPFALEADRAILKTPWVDEACADPGVVLDCLGLADM